MAKTDQLEKRIAELLEELGDALYPITRETFIHEMLSTDDVIAKMQNIDMEWRRNHKEQMWLDFLEEIKREKDAGSTQWQKMKRWD